MARVKLSLQFETCYIAVSGGHTFISNFAAAVYPSNLARFYACKTTNNFIWGYFDLARCNCQFRFFNLLENINVLGLKFLGLLVQNFRLSFLKYLSLYLKSASLASINF